MTEKQSSINPIYYEVVPGPKVPVYSVCLYVPFYVSDEKKNMLMIKLPSI